MIDADGVIGIGILPYHCSKTGHVNSGIGARYDLPKYQVRIFQGIKGESICSRFLNSENMVNFFTDISNEDDIDSYNVGDLIAQRYKVLKKINSGGNGIVYQVINVEIGAILALKSFRDDYFQEPEAWNQFKREAQIWIELEHHEYIVRAFSIVTALGRPFIEIEYIPPNMDGCNTLEDFLKTNPPDLIQCLKWSIQFCLGMEYAFNNRLRCHRDIKPGNIMISPENQVKITDFGLARVRDDAVGKKTGELYSCGTTEYRSPEHINNPAGCDERSDIYSFGIVLYQMTTQGMLPFTAYAESEYYEKDIEYGHLFGVVPRINSVLFPVILRCLNKDPNGRYQSFSELCHELDEILLRVSNEKISTQSHKMPEDIMLVLRGNSYGVLGKHIEAIYCFENAIQVNNKNVSAWIGLAVTYNVLDRPDEARFYIRRAIEIAPNNKNTWFNSGVFYAKSNRHDRAIRDFLQVLIIDKRDVQVWSDMGLSFAKIGYIFMALNCYVRSVELDPKDAYAWANLGAVIKGCTNDSFGDSCLMKACRIDPKITEKMKYFHINTR